MQESDDTNEFSQELLSEIFSDSDGASDQDLKVTDMPVENTINRHTFRSGSMFFWIEIMFLLFSDSPYFCSLSPRGGGRVVRWCWANFQCQGILLIWIIVGQGPTALAVDANGGLFGHFLSRLSFPFSFSLTLGGGLI